MNHESLRVLIVEDSEDDTLLVLRALKKGGYNPFYERVETAAAMKKALKEKQWDVILCEYSLSQFNAPSAINVLKEANIDIPLIVVTGTIGKETISEFMSLSVQGYIMKSNLSHLCPTIARELEEADISVQRKRADEALKKSEEKYRLLANNIHDVVFVLDMNLNYTYLSPSVKLLRGYEPKEAMKHTPAETLTPSSMDLALRTLSEIMEMEKSEQRDINISRTLQLEMKRKDGTTVWTEVKAFFVRDENQRPVGIMGVTRDITERKQAEDMIRESEERYRTLFEDAQDGIALADAETYLLIDCNQALCRMVERDKSELLGQAQNILHPPEDLIDGISPTFLKHQDNCGLALEDRLMARGGRLIPVEIRTAKIRIKNRNFLLGIFRDITERKRMEEKLRESEANYRQLFDNSPAAIYRIDFKSGKFLKANDLICEYIGCSQEEINSLSPYDVLTEDSKKLFLERLEKMSQGLKVPEIVEYEVLDKKGKRWCLQLHAKNIYDAEGHVVGADVVAHDITERKEAEGALKNSEAKYRDIFENAIEGIYQSTIEGRFITANEALARMAGYNSPEELIESIKDIETQLYVHPKDRKRFMEIREAKSFVDGFEVEFYKKDRSKFWGVVNARTVKDEQGKILYIEGLIEDITVRKHAEEQLQHTLDSLKKAVGTTIQVLGTASEARDPYTAGHQKRVADLARTIATEMGLSREKIEGIRLAGSIHDIGKISIPAEILSKPTKLTNTEISMIKEHPLSGYEMLKDVESPWPLAEIIYQHHERMNGAGYPRNLRDDAILIESRILAVADVVEAMASHRPYRATLGIEAALEEINKNKGILYDNTVADACLRLFREKGYQLT